MEEQYTQPDAPSGDVIPKGEYQDKTLKCKDCGDEFIWTAGEQEFFFSRGFKNKPTRCKECRKKNRQRVEAEYFKVTCSVCSQAGEVMLKPTSPEAKVFCKKCFDEQFLKQEQVSST